MTPKYNFLQTTEDANGLTIHYSRSSGTELAVMFLLIAAVVATVVYFSYLIQGASNLSLQGQEG